MNQQVRIDHIEIKDRNQKKNIIIQQNAVLSARINRSVFSYVHKSYCEINNKVYNAFPIFAIGNEVKIFASGSKNSKPEELFFGVVRKRQKKWDKAKDWDITQFWATSFAAEASTKMLYSWELEYTKGFNEVLSKLAASISLKSKWTKDKNSTGKVFFDHISVLDAMRLLAYQKGWCLSFEGKVVKISPCKKPKHSGVTINLADLPTGTITEG
jgi:hypothetical protein